MQARLFNFIKNFNIDDRDFNESLLMTEQFAFKESIAKLAKLAFREWRHRYIGINLYRSPVKNNIQNIYWLIENCLQAVLTSQLLNKLNPKSDEITLSPSFYISHDLRLQMIQAIGNIKGDLTEEAILSAINVAIENMLKEYEGQQNKKRKHDEIIEETKINNEDDSPPHRDTEVDQESKKTRVDLRPSADSEAPVGKASTIPGHEILKRKDIDLRQQENTYLPMTIDLFTAIIENDVAAIERLSRQKGFDPNVRHPITNDRPVCFAILCDSIDALKKLVECGADIYYEPQQVDESLMYLFVGHRGAYRRKLFNEIRKKRVSDIKKDSQNYKNYEAGITFLLEKNIPLAIALRGPLHWMSKAEFNLYADSKNIMIRAGKRWEINTSVLDLACGEICDLKFIHAAIERVPHELDFNNGVGLAVVTDRSTRLSDLVLQGIICANTDEEYNFARKIIKLMMDKGLPLNFNACYGDMITGSALSMLVTYRQWDLIKIILFKYPKTNFSLVETRMQEVKLLSNLWYIAQEEQWDLLLLILAEKKLNEIDVNLFLRYPTSSEEDIVPYFRFSPRNGTIIKSILFKIKYIENDDLRTKLLRQFIVRFILSYNPKIKNFTEIWDIFAELDESLNEQINVLQKMFEGVKTIFFITLRADIQHIFPLELILKIAYDFIDWNLNHDLQSKLVNLFYDMNVNEQQKIKFMNIEKLAKLSFIKWRHQRGIDLYSRVSKANVKDAYACIAECLLEKLPQLSDRKKNNIDESLRKRIVEKIGRLSLHGENINVLYKEHILTAIDDVLNETAELDPVQRRVFK